MKDRAPLRVVHVIAGRGVGGAETMLFRLLAHVRGKGAEGRVVALGGEGPVMARIRDLGIPVEVLPGTDPFSAAAAVIRLSRALRRLAPHVVQTWMYHADLIGGLAGRLAGVPVVWGLHNSTLLPGASRWSTRLLVALLARLSRRVPDKIISCAEAARRIHVEKGYDASRMTVIPNGFDLGLFRPDPAARARVRRELGLGEELLVAGHVARFHPQKDHRTFLRAAARVAARRPEARFLFCGEGAGSDNALLTGWAREEGVLERCRFLGPRADAAALMPALDVLVSSSRSGEAFPLVVGEAMACEVPCAVTDVGDSAFLVGQAGRVARPEDPAALAEAMEGFFAMPAEARRALGRAARARISENFSIERVAALYEDVYRTVAKEAQ